MEDSLTIRTYTKQRKGHAHLHHQLVLPIQGGILIDLGMRAKSLLITSSS